MTKVLALDSATEACSVALIVDGEEASLFEVSPQAHTKLLLPMVDKVLKEKGILLNDVDFLACGQGPGSFTGVRIGVSLAQGLAFGAEKKIVGVCNLEAMAYRAMVENNFEYCVSVIDARMGEVYLGIYKLVSENETIKITDEQVLKPEEAIQFIAKELVNKKFCCCGTGVKTYPQILTQFDLTELDVKYDLPTALSIAKLALVKFENGEAVDPECILPMYIRDTVTWKKVSEQGK
jgi:tRNA threonylcarbamoyladenosine biosynthesis protein TsaB